MSEDVRHIGIELHGISVNVGCDHEPLLDYLVRLLDGAVRPVFDAPDLVVTGLWRTRAPVDGDNAFADASETMTVPSFGKRMRMGGDELVWFNTHRDNNLQLRFRRRGPQFLFDVAYHYYPTAEKLARYPAYAERKFFTLARYLVQFPVAWHLARTRGWALLHASAVAFDGDAVLVAGPGGAGKTTTCIGLMARPGARLVSENLLFTDGTHVFPLCEPIRLTSDSLALLDAHQRGALVPLAVDGGAKHKVLFRPPEGDAGGPVRAAALFIPRFTECGSVTPIAAAVASEVLGAANRLTLELSDYDWYTAALDLVWPAPGQAMLQVSALAHLTASCPCYALGIDRNAGVDAVVDRILDCIGAHGAPGSERPAFAPEALRRVRRSFSGGGSAAERSPHPSAHEPRAGDPRPRATEPGRGAANAAASLGTPCAAERHVSPTDASVSGAAR